MSSKFFTLFLCGFIFAGCLPCITTQLFAQPYSEPAEKRLFVESSQTQGFQSVSGNQIEDVSGMNLLVLAYIFIWFLLFTYIIRIGRILSKTSEEIRRLERVLEENKEMDKNMRE